MNTNDTFGRGLSSWLHEEGEHRVPDHLAEVLLQTAATRQRPWWSSPERWLPMQTTLRLAPAPRVAWLLVVVALTIVIAMAVLAVGSAPRLPAPFGVAREGTLVASIDGDIYRVDPATGARTALIADPAFDFGASFSRDGTKLMFLRSPDPAHPDAGLMLAVANADGTGVRLLSPAVQGLDWQDWSPDGSRIAFLSRPSGGSGPGVINVVNVDGSGLQTLDVGRPAHMLSWLPPAGTEIVFRGEHLAATDPPVGIFAVRPDGTGLRQISTTPPVNDADYQDVAVSPDGTRVLYSHSDQHFQVHVLDLQSGEDRVLPSAPGAIGQSGGIFSPDGRMIAYRRWYEDDSTQLVVAPADGSTTGRALGPGAPGGSYGPTLSNYSFTPDGTAVVANYDAENLTRRLPIDGSAPTVVAQGAGSFATYQRLAR